MLISFNWLKEYVPITLDPSALANLLTMAGLEVERVTPIGEGLEGVVVGRITSRIPHPHADALHLCTVDTGNATHTIVCGASNINIGDIVPLALEGTQLPNGKNIKTMKIRGVISEGMLCSEAELGLGPDTSGIMILPSHLMIGQPLSSALDLKDYIFQISITPNRPDCLSILGIAREIAALTRQKLTIPALHREEKDGDIDQLLSVTIEAPDLCPRYCARIIRQATVRPSPFWLRKRLESCGMRSINNVVDVTNYLLLELGQPLHAFDLDRLDQPCIVVKRSTPGQLFTTLDGKERLLPQDAVMICDGTKPIALGGIMGGMNSEVCENTSAILLESAYFTPSAIRKTSKRTGIRTESSQRFEKGVDPCGVPIALHRAAQLIAQISGGTIISGYKDIYPNPIAPPRPIILSTDKVNRTLGTSLNQDTIKQTLECLSFVTQVSNPHQLTVTPPSFRVDVAEDVDLIEEIARLIGYDNIHASLPSIRPSVPKKDKNLLLEKTIKDSLTQQGYYEVITYSFIAPHQLLWLNLSEDDPRLHPLILLNPLSEEQSVMRTTLLPGLLATAKKNINQKNLNLKFFELGNIFLPRGKGMLPQEKKVLAALATGAFQEEGWNVEKRNLDFYDLKGVMENLLEVLHINHFAFTPSPTCPFLHPLRSLQILINNDLIGFFGEAHPDVLEKVQIPQPVYLMEISLAPLLIHFSDYLPFRPLPKYPPVYRDIALVVDENIPAQKVYEIISRFKNKFIEEIVIFDYYKGKQIPHGKKGLAYRLKYQAYDRTLTDQEANALTEELMNALHQEIGATIR